MEELSPTAVGVMLALVYGLVEIAKFAIQSKRANGFGAEEGKVLRSVKVVTDEILKMHARYDKDGLPLWYVPREWGEAQKELVVEAKETNKRLGDLAVALQALASKV